jgi:hypothetical protein
MYGFVNEEMGFRTIKSLTSLSAFGSIFVITPFLPPKFSRVSTRKTRQPEPSRPDPMRAHHTK